MDNVLLVSKQEIEKIEAANKRVFFRTNLEFLFEHKGFRLGKVHLFQGASGGGKSTMVKTVILDFLVSNPDRIASIWLSEENREDFIAETANHPLLKEKLLEGRLKLFSEIQKSISKHELETNLLEFFSTSEILFFDNLTTSQFYLDKTPNEQAKVITGLKSLTKKFNIPLVIFAHTGGNDQIIRLTSQNDVRGSKSVVNFAEHIYMILTLEMGDRKLTTLRTVKARGRTIKSFGYFLTYDDKTLTYTKARQKDHGTFQKAIKLSKKVMGQS